jgi:methylenetetrahydrofolate dehydrogenase (NADP+)/methenyltetrahydrofolate cyclohydrolase
MGVSMDTIVINGRQLASEIKTTLAKELRYLIKKHGITPLMTTITVGHDPTSGLYLRLRENACQEAGIATQHLSFKEDCTEEQVLQAIQALNADDTRHGILIQYPVPKHLRPERLMATVDPRKDIEGFHPVNLGNTMIGREDLVPCTPLAVVCILEHAAVALQGKDVVIVNHSTVVGKPLTALFLNRNATVAVCHVFTKDLKRYARKADILVSAAGVPGLITADHVAEHAVVIDVGITDTKDGIRGDVVFDTVKEKTSIITPVPGGVGPVTIACALSNMVKTYKNYLETL